MDSPRRNLVICGIEPVDELRGGLEAGGLFLVHGEASGASVFAIKFLIQGLSANENCALVTRYSPEEAVRRFTSLGYNCLEDVYSGRLVILEYSDDIIEKLGKLRELTPVLRELAWLLGETRPSRLVFDPVTSVLAGAEGDLGTRARDFADWARSLGATVVLSGDDSTEVTESFAPQVDESFRLDAKEIDNRIERVIVFEKSPDLLEQRIEIDPARGIFLLGRPQAGGSAPHPPSVADLESIREELRSIRNRIQEDEPEPLIDIDLVAESPEPSSAAARTNLQTSRLVTEPWKAEPKPLTADIEELDVSFEEPKPAEIAPEQPPDELSGLLDDLSGTASPLDFDLSKLEVSEKEPVIGVSGIDIDVEEAAPSEAPTSTEPEPAQPPSSMHGRAADARIDEAMAKQAIDLLLNPAEAPEVTTEPYRPEEPAKTPAVTEAQPRDFNVLVIEDDPDSCDLLTEALSEYALEVVHDGMSGLATLLSFKPDLVVLGFDLPIVDGFKILSLIRSSLSVPIIIVSGSRLRAIDRVMASELGADYFLMRPFSTKELKYKARQLIARYRDISSWIINPPRRSPRQSGAGGSNPSSEGIDNPSGSDHETEPFTSYNEFEAEVERRVRDSKEGDPPFSILRCGLAGMTARGGRLAFRLWEIVHGLKRETDLTSTNRRNELVVLLHDADKRGARAFARRLRVRVKEELRIEPALSFGSFPDVAESNEAFFAGNPPQSRRASDAPPA